MKRLTAGSLLFALMSLILILSTVFVVGCNNTPAATPTTASAQQPKGQGTPYKIGFTVSATGAASYLGEPERDVAVMVQKQLDATGGITGPDGIVHPVKIVIQDTQGSSDVAVPVAKKLIDDEKVVAILGPSTSPETMALIPIVQEAQLPMLSMASSSGIVKPAAERKWVFKVAQSNEHTSPWQVEYAKAKGLTKIANIYVNNAYGEDGAAAIRQAAKEGGLEIVLEDTFKADDTDMTAQITKIKASQAQAVLVTAIPPAAAVFTKQYREMGLALPLLHNSGIGTPAFVDVAGAANAEGVIFPMGKLVAVSSLPDSDAQKKVIAQFISDYQASAGKLPSHFGAHAWDAIQITLQVLKTLPDGLPVDQQRARLRDGIEQLTGFVGVDGVFNFSAEDHVGLSKADVVLVQIKDGKWGYLPPDKW
jgi:branched-chain amino acid transport system substrate-binding protein